MADFYYDSLMMHNSTHPGFILDPAGSSLSTSSTGTNNDERDCFNATELEAVPSRFGQLFLIILYSLTSILALIGNVTVIVVEICGKESAHNIRKYLINLAVSDITIGVLCVPFTYTDFMLGQWIFPHWLCPTAQFVQLLSVFVTSLTLTFIGIERYMATLHPFSSIHHWLECHTHIMLALTWVFGAAYAYIPFENTATRSFTLPTDNQTTYYECSYDNGVSVLKRRLFMTSNIVLTFILPLMILIFSYSAIMRKLIHDERRFRKSSHYAYGIKFKTPITQQQQAIKSTVVESVRYSNGSSSSGGCDFHKNSATETGNSILVPNNKNHTVNEQDVDEKVYNKNNTKMKILNKCNFIVEDTLNKINNNISPLTKDSSEMEIIKPSNIDVGGECSTIQDNSPNRFYSSNNQLSTSNIDLRKSTPFNYRSKTIKMMFTVILLYGICWMPIKLYQFLMDYGLIVYCTERELYAMVCLYFICHWMAMANSFANPIIYSFMSKSFRNDFRKITQTFRQTFSKNINQLSININQLSIKTASTQV